MFNRLRQKWNVDWLQFALIFITFAVGGSLCGYAGRKLLLLFSIGNYWVELALYIVLVTLLWPLSVLAVSLPLGQFSFFKKFIGRLFRHITSAKSLQPTIMASPTRIAIFASGGGSNAKKIIDYFADGHSNIQVALIVCNKPGAGVISIAQQTAIPVLLIDKGKFFSPGSYIAELQQTNIQFIVLAGFLWKMPDVLIKAWPQKIVNIHPALLPKYGGKGMYGHFVHEAVIASGDVESGITIHYVDEQYDHGRHLLQVRCPVMPGDTPESLANRVLALEHQHFAKTIEQAILHS